MRFHFILVALALESAEAFQLLSTPSAVLSSSALCAKSRKARRVDKVEKQARGRSKQFYDAIHMISSYLQSMLPPYSSQDFSQN